MKQKDGVGKLSSASKMETRCEHTAKSLCCSDRAETINTHMRHFATFQSNKSSLIIIILCDICANSFQQYAVRQKGVWDALPSCQSNRCPDSPSE